jgi:seryl-tRNA synthetase
VETLKARKNEVSKQIGLYKREGKDTSEIQASVQSIMKPSNNWMKLSSNWMKK